MSGKTTPCGIFVGAETGLVKGVKISAENKSWINVNSVQNVSREREIISMCWTSLDQSSFYCGLRNRTVDVYSRDDPKFVSTITDIGGDGVLKAVAPLNNSLVTCTEKGNLRVTSDGNTEIAIEAGDNIHCMRQNNEKPHIIATGGKENCLKLWNLEAPESPIFTAKNVKNDWLNLRVPICVMDVGFFPQSDKVVTCTGHHHVRIYDPSSSQKRPVLQVEVDDYPITCLSVRQGYQQVIIGNTQGLMALVDLRGKGYMVQKYKGFAGAINSIYYQPSDGSIVSCGLDRFLCVHDVNSKALRHKVYLKSRLNSVLVADDWNCSMSDDAKSVKSQSSEAIDIEVDASETDQLWEQMPTVGKRKHKDNPDGDSLNCDLFTDVQVKEECDTEEAPPIKKKSKHKKKMMKHQA